MSESIYEFIDPSEVGSVNRETREEWEAAIREFKDSRNFWRLAAVRNTHADAQKVARIFRNERDFHVRCKTHKPTGKVRVLVLYGEPKNARTPDHLSKNEDLPGKATK